MKSSTDRLADASEKGLVNEVESYLDAGIDPDISGSDGVAPIVRATANGHSHIAKILLRKGAAVDTVHPASGKSALHLAAQSGQVVLAKVLLAGGAEIEKTDKDGATPLQLAAGGKSGDMVRALIAAGAHVDVVDAKNAHTVLHRAALSGNAEVVEKLLRVGADLEGRDRAGGTALHLAAKEGRLGLVRCLVRSGGDPGAVDMIGRNPLYIAAAQGHTKVRNARVCVDRHDAAIQRRCMYKSTVDTTTFEAFSLPYNSCWAVIVQSHSTMGKWGYHTSLASITSS